MTRKKTEKQPGSVRPVKTAVHIALNAAHAKADVLGRALHPAEARWVIRHEFRERFAMLDDLSANRFADYTIKEIGAMHELSV